MFTSNEKGEFFTESKGMRKIEEEALENYCHFLVAMDFFSTLRVSRLHHFQINIYK